MRDARRNQIESLLRAFEDESGKFRAACQNLRNLEESLKDGPDYTRDLELARIELYDLARALTALLEGS
jgi:hypothetical protein